MVTLPKLNKLTISIAAGIGIILIIGISILANVSQQKKDDAPVDANAPSFQSILPKGKSIDSLGGWQKLTPPNSEPVYVFVDTIKGVAINVSQQQLPASFNDDTDSKVAELAKGYNATNSFDASGTKVYIGLSSNGPQSVIFTKSGLLVLIKSQKQLSNDDWTSYISSLT